MILKIIKFIGVFLIIFLLFSSGGYLKNILDGFNIANARFISVTVVRIIMIAGLIKLISIDGLYGFVRQNNHHPLVYILPIIIIGLVLFNAGEEKFSILAEINKLTVFFFLLDLIIAAAFEEILCRVFLFGSLISVLKGSALSRTIIAALLSSLFFGLFHYFNLFSDVNSFLGITSQVITAFGLGMVFCGIYVLSRNILIPILFHFILNLLGGGLRHLDKVIESEPVQGVTDIISPSITSLIVGPLIMAVFLSLVGIILIYFSNRTKFIHERLSDYYHR